MNEGTETKLTELELNFLNYMGQYRFTFPGGSFTQALFHAFQCADWTNSVKLARAFPDHHNAVAGWFSGDLLERYDQYCAEQGA